MNWSIGEMLETFGFPVDKDNFETVIHAKIPSRIEIQSQEGSGVDG